MINYLYADDTIVNTSAPSVQQAMSDLQHGFNSIQKALIDLKLVLNAKTKILDLLTLHLG